MKVTNISGTARPVGAISDFELSIQKAVERALVNIWLPSQIKEGGRDKGVDAALEAISQQKNDKLYGVWPDKSPIPPPHREYHPGGLLRSEIPAKVGSPWVTDALKVVSVLLQLVTIALLIQVLDRL